MEDGLENDGQEITEAQVISASAILEDTSGFNEPIQKKAEGVLLTSLRSTDDKVRLMGNLTVLEHLSRNSDAAMTVQHPPVAKAKADGAMTVTPGGIDLDRARMQMNIKRDPSASPQDDGSAFKLDPDVIEHIRRQGFDGLEFKIDTIIPITNLPILLGLREDEQQGHPQLAGV